VWVGGLGRGPWLNDKQPEHPRVRRSTKKRRAKEREEVKDKRIEGKKGSGKVDSLCQGIRKKRDGGASKNPILQPHIKGGEIK